MSINTSDLLIAGLRGAQRRNFQKSSATAEGAGTWHSLWMVAGYPGAASTPPSTAAVPVDSDTGSFAFTNPAGGVDSNLGLVCAAGATIGTLIIYDRLMHVSGLSGTVTTTDTAVSNTALTRYTDGVGVEAWGEIYSAIGATGATLNIRYTDQDGNTNQVGTYAHPANAESVGQMFPFVLAAGDTGVRAVTNYHWSVSTGTAGNWGITLLKRLATIPLQVANVATIMNAIDIGMPEVYDDACLALMVQCSTTNTGSISGYFDIIQG